MIPVLLAQVVNSNVFIYCTIPYESKELGGRYLDSAVVLDRIGWYFAAGTAYIDETR
jgi:hypothetical protein